MAGGWPDSVGGRGESVSIRERGKPVACKAKLGGGRGNSVGGRMYPYVAGLTLLVEGCC